MRIEHPSLTSWTFALRGFQLYRFLKDKWPAFMFEDPLSRKMWPWLYIRFPRYQFIVFDGRKIIAAANSVPVHFEGNLSELPATGWTWAILKAFADRREGRVPNAQVMLSIVVAEAARVKGFSAQMIETVKAIGKREGLRFALAPVRPSRKSEFPTMPMEDYVRKQTEDGRMFDPWLRAHVAVGGKVLSVCEQSMTIQGSIKTWCRWTNRSFTQSGSFPVAGALTPITIEMEKNLGTYVEPNVWVLHEYAASSGA
jgi:hypothetical protein